MSRTLASKRRQKRCRRVARNTRTTRARTRRCGGVAVSSKKRQRQRQSRRGGSTSSEDRRRHEREQREADAQKEEAHQKAEKEKKRTAKQKAKRAQDAAKEKRKAEKEAAKRADNGKKILESAKKSAKAFRKELHKQLFEDGDYAGKRVTEAQERQMLLELCDKMGLKKPPKGMKELYEYVREDVKSGGWLRALGTWGGGLGGLVGTGWMVVNRINRCNYKKKISKQPVPTNDEKVQIQKILEGYYKNIFTGLTAATIGGVIAYVSSNSPQNKHHIISHIAANTRKKKQGGMFWYCPNLNCHKYDITGISNDEDKCPSCNKARPPYEWGSMGYKHPITLHISVDPHNDTDKYTKTINYMNSKELFRMMQSEYSGKEIIITDTKDNIISNDENQLSLCAYNVYVNSEVEQAQQRALQRTAAAAAMHQQQWQQQQLEEEKECSKNVREQQDEDSYLQKFAQLYKSGYEPPIWSTNGTQNFSEQYNKCRVFYDAVSTDRNSIDLLSQLKLLVYEREPVNIKMKRYYDDDALQRLYGHRTGAYARLLPQSSCGSITPPNIVLYTPATVQRGHAGYYNNVHILHAIGLSFDSPEQRDYKLYAKYTKAQRVKHAVAFYERVFRKLYYAAKHLGLTTLVLSLVGANNFAKAWWHGGIDGFQAQVWAPAYANTQHLADGLDVCIMGAKGSRLQHTFGWKDIGYFPACIERVDVSNTAFVNAWDCWSVPGNGNARDNSLDGFVGRVSNVGVLGNGMTNAWLRKNDAYVAVKSKAN